MAAPISEPTATAASPPPSPLPAPPEDSTPGARAIALQNAFAKALEATLNKCSYDNFAACFPTPAQYRPQTLEMFHKDFTGRLSEVCSVNTADFWYRGSNADMDRLNSRQS
jgi:kinetochore protein NNF1